ncbi:MAG: ferritin [Bacteroidales bacterium]|nr:ferritin [Bacteroidales bacterium]
MLSEKMLNILNEQVVKEAYASHLYLAMASWADVQGFEGISAWFYAQAEEEREHMLKLIHYINERGGHAIVPLVEQPPQEFKGVKELFDASLEHEQMVTAAINEIVSLALTEKDYTTNNWIQWFVDEQLEEETSVQAIIDKLNILGDHNMYIFDRDIMSMRGKE